jgi:beta-glucosidase
MRGRKAIAARSFVAKFSGYQNNGNRVVSAVPRTRDHPTSHSATVEVLATDALSIRYTGGIFMGYRGYEKNHIQPQYPFGYGLS